MNQILNMPSLKKIKYMYLVFLLFSILVILSLFAYMLFLEYRKNNENKIAKQMAQSYAISRLYSNSESVPFNASIINKPYIIGIISIPSISLSLPVISEMNDELLKVSVCRFYGPTDSSSRKHMYCWP